MKPFSATITRRLRKRKQRSGEIVEQPRWFVNYRDPDTGQRKLPSFERKRDAEAFRDELVGKVDDGSYTDPDFVPTIVEAVEHWLEARELHVKQSTLKGCRVASKAITGPLLQGTKRERWNYARTGKKPSRETKLLKMIGDIKANELTTAQIRKWHRQVQEEVGLYTANRAKTLLKSVLALAEEDFRVRAPAMPTNLPRRKSKPKKEILSMEHVTQLLEHAKADHDRGIYYAFPFLAGTRSSEQLGLLWEDIDFDNNVIRICRI